MIRNMVWFLFKMLFNESGFKKTLKKLSVEKVTEFKQKALDEENFELAAFLGYYLEFKKFKTDVDERNN